MYRNDEWRAFQFYVLPGWKGGLYASPTLAGSRCVFREPLSRPP